MDTADYMEPLTGRRRADAVIIGGGLTGLMLGTVLTQKGLRVIVLEGGRIGSGASGLCSGTVTLQQYGAFSRIRQVHGLCAARDYTSLLRQEAGRFVRRFGSMTAWQRTDCYTYAFLPRDLPALWEQQALYEALGIPCMQAPDAGGCPFPVELSLMTRDQLTIDAGQLLTVLAQRIRQNGGLLWENTPALHIAPHMVYTAKACIGAPFVAMCTGMPLGIRHRRLLALLETHTLLGSRLTSQVPLHTVQLSVRPDGLSLRPFPGGAYAAWDLGRVGSRDMDRQAALFRRVLDGRLPEWEAAEAQARQDVWSMDGLPVIGALSDAGGLLCACGYGGWGLTGASLACDVLSRRILGRKEPQDQLFSPGRTLPEKTERMLLHRIGSFRRRNSRRMLSPRCPHLGCRMRYSQATERWGCPYCGSVFSMLGRRISGPAMRMADVSPVHRPVR